MDSGSKRKVRKSVHMHTITLHEETNPSNLGTSMGATWSAVMPALSEPMLTNTYCSLRIANKI